MRLSVRRNRLSSHVGITGACGALALAALACSSSVEPRAGVTLLVTNESCQSGQCDSLEVLAFPSVQPNTPGGFWSLDLGVITTARKCFTLPPAAHFQVIGQHSDGGVDTVTYTWTNASGLALGAQPPAQSRIQASPSTSAFVPATAAGWRIDVPSGVEATADDACTA